MSGKADLLRQIEKAQILGDGRIDSRAFRPKPKKDGTCLSVSDAEAKGPEAAWDHFTRVLKHRSAGVLGLTNAECTSLGLDVEPDPQENFEEHACVSFEGLSPGQQKKKSSKLRDLAVDRDWLHGPVA